MGRMFGARFIRPPFNVISPELLLRWKYLFPLAGMLIWVLEFGYPFFIWSRRTRRIWLFGICGLHIAIGLTMGMYLFFTDHDCPQRGCVRARAVSRMRQTDRFGATDSCFLM